MISQSIMQYFFPLFILLFDNTKTHFPFVPAFGHFFCSSCADCHLFGHYAWTILTVCWCLLENMLSTTDHRNEKRFKEYKSEFDGTHEHDKRYVKKQQYGSSNGWCGIPNTGIQATECFQFEEKRNTTYEEKLLPKVIGWTEE